MDQLTFFTIKRSAITAHFKKVFRSLDLNHNNVCGMRLIEVEVALYEMKESHEEILQLNKNIELILLVIGASPSSSRTSPQPETGVDRTACIIFKY